MEKSQQLIFEDLEEEPEDKVAQCGLCQLEHGCKSPKMPVHGQGRRNILVVAEAPGDVEDVQGVQLVGKAGKLLRHTLERFGVGLDRDCWKTNAVICHPPGNTLPPKAIDYCRPTLLATIKQLRPRVIVLLGGSPVQSLMHYLWPGEPVGAIGRWVGWQIPCQKLNAWVCPTWHPSYVARSGVDFLDPYGRGGDRGLFLWFARHLKRAFQLEGRPYETVPNFESQIRLLHAGTAAAHIEYLTDTDQPIAFDFETDRLKPDEPGSRIICCSICDGTLSFAFPWEGAAITAMGRLLDSKTPKIGANIKFEDRWCRREFGHGVRNWVHDVVQTAHWEDNRGGITSVKFQSFVRLGYVIDESKVKPYFKVDSGNAMNAIREVRMDDLLRYCALDSLVEWKLAEKQNRNLQKI